LELLQTFYGLFFNKMQPTDNKSIAKRLEEVIADVKPKSKRAFAISINADPSFFDKILKGKASLTENIASSIAEKYGVDLEWLLMGQGTRHPNERRGQRPTSTDYQTKYILQLEKENQYLQDIVKTNLTLVLATVRTLSVRQRAVSEVILDSLERLELEVKPKKKAAGAFVELADRNIDQIEREAHAYDSVAAPSR
jgi:transcriptional regulator with XRE-family HTH domain